MTLIWTDQLSVGNESIDMEHKNLVYLVNSTIQAISTRNQASLTQTFKQLERELRLHFITEEKISQKINFDFSYHHLVQQYILNELLFLKNILTSKNCLWFDSALEHFTHFLKNWIIDEHIVKLDMRMKPALQAYPYSFSVDSD